MINFRSNLDVSAKLIDDLFGNSKSKTDTLLVHFLCVVQESKKLEKFFLVTRGDTYSIVFTLNLDVALGCDLGVSVQLKIDLDVSSIRCKLKSIRDQVQNDLLNSLRIRHNLEIVWLTILLWLPVDELS